MAIDIIDCACRPFDSAFFSSLFSTFPLITPPSQRPNCSSVRSSERQREIAHVSSNHTSVFLRGAEAQKSRSAIEFLLRIPSSHRNLTKICREWSHESHTPITAPTASFRIFARYTYANGTNVKREGRWYRGLELRSAARNDQGQHGYFDSPNTAMNGTEAVRPYRPEPFRDAVMHRSLQAPVRMALRLAST